MELQQFLKRRKDEAEWLHLNGYENEDPEQNGQYKVIDALSNYFSCFVDIGANIGSFSKRLAGKKLVMFEPVPSLAQDLKNIGTVYATALGEKKGKVTFTIHQDHATSSRYDRTLMSRRSQVREGR
jgi:hypothetical protein